MSPDLQDAQSNWILIGAIGLSVALHLILLAVFSLFSFASAVLVERPEDEIRFSFAQPTEATLTDRPPPGDLGERAEMRERLRQPAPQPSIQPLPVPPGELQPAPVEPPSGRPQPNPDLSRSEPQQPDATDREFAEVEAAEVESGVELPNADRGTIRAGRQAPDGGVTLDRALANFGEAVRNAQSRNPQAAPPSRRNLFVPEAVDLPPDGVGYGMFEFESRDYDWSDYMRQLYVEVMRTWYPTMDRSVADFERWGKQHDLFLRDRVTVKFTIQKSGDVTDIRVVVPSLCGPLDDSATDTLEIVLLQPLPSDFPRDSETVTGTFLVEGWTHQMGPYFNWLKRQGHWTMKSRALRLENDPLNPYSSPRN